MKAIIFNNRKQVRIMNKLFVFGLGIIILLIFAIQIKELNFWAGSFCIFITGGFIGYFAKYLSQHIDII